MPCDQDKPLELTLRDCLAIDRTRMANERTLLAYLRTSFMLIIAGGTAIRLFGDSLFFVSTAWALIGLGGIFLVLGAYRFMAVRQAIDRLDWTSTSERETDNGEGVSERLDSERSEGCR